VWVNATNLFDAAAGFGGYRESGYGREGGREGMWEYLAPVTTPAGRAGRAGASVRAKGQGARAVAATPITEALPPIDRTPKLFVGGKQVRPDSGYARVIADPKGRRIGEVGEGNRKDLRNAVEAARAAVSGWSRATAHLRAQILYYVAENLSARRDEFASRLRAMTGGTAARAEVEASIDRLFTYGAWADKWDGAVHHVPIRGIAIAMPEAIGVVGVAAPDEAPLLGLVSTIAPLVATGNAVVAIPSEPHPLAATDLYTVFESSDVPAGVINLVTGAKDALAAVLAAHDDVDAVWYWGTAAGRTAVEAASIGNLKRTWCHTSPVDWSAAPDAPAFLREATHVKNIWVPYGE